MVRIVKINTLECFLRKKARLSPCFYHLLKINHAVDAATELFLQLVPRCGSRSQTHYRTTTSL
jgi:hypothetical protein